MSIHVAIVRPPFDRLILEGVKTIESRLSRHQRPPFGRVAPGERLFFKRSGGPFFATAVADQVWMSDRLTRRRVDWLRHRFDDRVCGGATYWRGARSMRYATLVWLRDVEPCTLRPRYKRQHMRAWYVLEESADPLAGAGAGTDGTFELELTAGMIRQSQVRLGPLAAQLPKACHGGSTKAEAGRPVRLRLKHGPVIETDVVADKRMFRWRGWGRWFEACGLRPGDLLRFTPNGTRAYRVEPVRVGMH